jgi:hypothetical protein
VSPTPPRRAPLVCRAIRAEVAGGRRELHVAWIAPTLITEEITAWAWPESTRTALSLTETTDPAQITVAREATEQVVKEYDGAGPVAMNGAESRCCILTGRRNDDSAMCFAAAAEPYRD